LAHAAAFAPFTFDVMLIRAAVAFDTVVKLANAFFNVLALPLHMLA